MNKKQFLKLNSFRFKMTIVHRWDSDPRFVYLDHITDISIHNKNSGIYSLSSSKSDFVSIGRINGIVK